MARRAPRSGDVLLVAFPEHDPQGHEQEGMRPALVLASPTGARFPVLLVAPMTTDRGQPWAAAAPWLYPRLAKGTAGLPADSIVLLDQARSVDAERARRVLGALDAGVQKAVMAAWSKIFRHAS
jgi:mRNA interferase MazF